MAAGRRKARASAVENAAVDVRSCVQGVRTERQCNGEIRGRTDEQKACVESTARVGRGIRRIAVEMREMEAHWKFSSTFDIQWTARQGPDDWPITDSVAPRFTKSALITRA